MFWKRSPRKKNGRQPDAPNTAVTDSVSVNAIVMSDLGNIRTNNEDMGLFFKVSDEQVLREKGYMLIVADGMGGHKAGEVASRLAAETISHEYFNLKGNGSIEKNLARAFAGANKTIYEMAATNSAYKGMGTTCTTIVVTAQTIYYAHAGDSRAYLLHNNIINQITEDHTYVQDLVNKGELTAEDAAKHPERNILTNAMGTKPDLRIDTGVYKLPFTENDKLLLCSDGLYDYVDAGEMEEVLVSMPIYDAAMYLIEQAKRRGGHDNITVVLAEKTTAEKTSTAKETRDIDLPTTREFDLP